MSKIDWSKAPEDATHAATTSSGEVCWYKLVPGSEYAFRYARSRYDHWSIGACSEPCHQPLERRPEENSREDWCEVGKKVEVKTTGSVNKILRVSDDDGVLLDSGVWRCRTELKPYSDHEPQWVPGELPPSGIECEYRFAISGWSVVKILSHGDSDNGRVAVFQGPHGVHIAGDSSLFRPIQSHRDKVIEAAYRAAGYMTADGPMAPDAVEKAVEAIVDAGLLKLPEGE